MIRHLIPRVQAGRNWCEAMTGEGIWKDAADGWFVAAQWLGLYVSLTIAPVHRIRP
jgi:hypothetical protein